MFWKKKKNVKPVKDFGIETANYGPLPYVHFEKFEHFSEDPDEEGRRLLEGFDDEQLDEYSGSLADPFIESLAEIDEAYIDRQHSENLAVIEHNKHVIDGETCLVKGKQEMFRNIRVALLNKSDKIY